MDLESRTFTLLAEPPDYRSPGRKPTVDMGAPLPLGYAAAVRRAAQLRSEHPGIWTWKVIAQVMGEYHGVWYSQNWWRQHVRRAGVAPEGRGDHTRHSFLPGYDPRRRDGSLDRKAVPA